MYPTSVTCIHFFTSMLDYITNVTANKKNDIQYAYETK